MRTSAILLLRSIAILASLLVLFVCGIASAPLSASAASQPAFYVATNGNDSWSGTLDAPNLTNTDGPFKTFTKAQTAMENSTTKTTYIRAGTYFPPAVPPSCNGVAACGCNGLSAIDLTSADTGETWSYYPPDGYNTAILDGSAPFVTQTGDTTAYPTLSQLSCAFSSESATNITINGLQFQHWRLGAFDGTARITFINNIVHDQRLVRDGGAPVSLSCGNGSLIANNYVYNVPYHGISLGCGTYDQDVTISGNAIMNSCTWNANQLAANGGDCGGIYISIKGPQALSDSNINVTNNYIWDVNKSSNGAGSFGICCAQGIYLDGAYNITMTGNVIGGIKSACFSTDGGGNRFVGNVCDISNPNNPGIQFMAQDNYQDQLYSTGGNAFQNNIVVVNNGNGGNGFNTFATCSLPSCPSNRMAIANNAYFNYNGSFVTNSGGGDSDATPTYENPLINCWAPSIASSSPVFNPSVSFPGIIGGWGPPGFMIPQTGTPPSWPHACSGYATTSPTVSLTILPSFIIKGATSSLSWSSTNATSCTGTNFETASSASGSLIVSPLITTIYSLTCSNASSSVSTSTTLVVITAPKDTTPPSVPSNLTTTPLSTSQIALTWSTSTDNVAVSGYKVYRGSLQIATSSLPSYQDTGLSPATKYTYAVSAFDTSNNVSAASLSVSTTTLSLPSLKAGTPVVTTAKVNVRSKPSTSGGSKTLGTQNAGATGTITQGPQSGSGYTWWYVNFASGADGWVASTYLQSRVVAEANAPSLATNLIGGELAVVTAVNVRDIPSLSGSILGVAPFMATGTVIGNPSIADGHTWIRALYANGITGWSASAYLAVNPPHATEPSTLQDQIASLFAKLDEVKKGIEGMVVR